ncbi:TetR/AcrR family transcriptional regulator [Mucilaginibacter jinjuensis]|uniref:TetR/AcrR family transcriptional regulator n=1 Tax=Mucilaginibacter jinjuensis TaxID=1176721 RepID=A0ABY7T0E4_9SPHI|nr:TetR/AcrR family transcriptional regulator [Mucilaginibacter jinjuensis]WCT09899.1 TetR/AcrR family transcriptional regulator [Mucilaginibacter jinjuensis]
MKPVVVLDKIMETAERLFYEQGYNLTGINQIIEEANISKPSLYNHFKSKNDLLLAYLDQAYSKWFEDLAIFTAGMTTPFDRLIALFDYRISRQIKTDFKGCAFVKISGEVSNDNIDVFERTKKYKNDIKAHVIDLVKQLDRPKDRLLSNDELAETIFSMLEGSLLMAKINKSYQPLEDAKNIVRKLV